MRIEAIEWFASGTKVRKQRAGAARIFGVYAAHATQALFCAAREIAEVTDRRGNDEKSAWHGLAIASSSRRLSRDACSLVLDGVAERCL